MHHPVEPRAARHRMVIDEELPVGGVQIGRGTGFSQRRQPGKGESMDAAEDGLTVPAGHRGAVERARRLRQLKPGTLD